jgi:hypothetical protein
LTGAENASQDQSTLPFNPKSTNPDLFNANTDGTNGMDFPNMMNGLNNVDYNQMMQMMAANGMGGFNPMMGEFSLRPWCLPATPPTNRPQGCRWE